MRIRTVIRACTTVTFPLTVACASMPPQQPLEDRALHPRGTVLTGRSADVISERELAAVSASNALEALRRLRPELVQPRVPSVGTDPGLPLLYVDGARHGRIDILASMPASLIRDMRYYRPEEARSRFGLLAGEGVLLVRTHR